MDLVFNVVFNGLMDMFDLMKINNIDKVFLLFGMYECGLEVFGKGEVGIWF